MLFVVLVATCELASRVKLDRDSGERGEEGHLVSAALGLLALLLGFTFSLALERYETRRALVVEEANAIGTVWLRADFLAAGERDRLKRLLVTYTDTRLAMAAAGEDARAVAAAEARTAAQQAAIWRLVEPAAALSSQPLAAQLVGSMNAMFDLAASRHAALAARIPTRVVAVLGLYALITAAILGYAVGHGRARHRWATAALFALLALTIGLILDLDRPRSGAIIVSQAPLGDLRGAMVWP